MIRRSREIPFIGQASIVPRQNRVTRRSIIVGLRPRQLRFAQLPFFLGETADPPQATAVAHLLPACRTPKNAEELSQSQDCECSCRGPAFSDPKGTSRPSAEGKESGEGKAEQPLGSRGRGPPRIFAYFLFVKKVWPAAASGRVKTR